MLKGFTSQLTNNVTARPRGLAKTPRSPPKSIFSIMGKIMSQMRMAIGTFTWESVPNSSFPI